MENAKRGNMQVNTLEEIVKLQPKGVFTIPKKLRVDLKIEDDALLRVKTEKGRLIVEVVRTLSYPVRSYTNDEIDEFLAFDKEETKQLKKKKIIK